MPAPKNSLVIDPEGKVLFASTFFCDLVHIDFKKSGGKSFFDFIFPEDTEMVTARLEDTKRPHASPFLLKLKRSDGAPVWTEFQGLRIGSTSGGVCAMTATVTLVSGPPENVFSLGSKNKLLNKYTDLRYMSSVLSGTH